MHSIAFGLGLGLGLGKIWPKENGITSGLGLKDPKRGKEDQTCRPVAVNNMPAYCEVPIPNHETSFAMKRSIATRGVTGNQQHMSPRRAPLQPVRTMPPKTHQLRPAANKLQHVEVDCSWLRGSRPRKPHYGYDYEPSHGFSLLCKFMGPGNTPTLSPMKAPLQPMRWVNAGAIILR